MRILFLASRDWNNPYAAGGDIHSSQLAIFMAKQNHKVEYICTSFPGCKKEEEKEGVKIIRLGNQWLFSLRVFLYYLFNCRNRFNIVYAEVIGGTRIPILAPLYIRKPLIVIWFQMNQEIFLHQYPKLLAYILTIFEKFLARLHRNRRIITPSEDSRRDLIKHLRIPPENVTVINPGIGEDWLNEMPAGEPREPLVVWIGKIRRYKCPHLAIQAMKEVCHVHPESKLIIGGRREDIKYERALAELALELNISENLEIRINISEDEKKSLLSRARVLVLPSPVEGFGITVLEANARGTPAVVSEGVPENAVRHGYNGLRVPVGDTEALSTSIVNLLEDDNLWQTLSQNGMNFVKDFTWPQVCAKFEKLAMEVAKG